MQSILKLLMKYFIFFFFGDVSLKFAILQKISIQTIFVSSDQKLVA